VAKLGRVPPNVFSASFGLTGLAEVWGIAERYGITPAGVTRALYILAAAVWLLSCVVYFARPRDVRADLLDNVGAPFIAVALIVPMLLASLGLQPYAHGAAVVLVDVFVVLTVLYGGILTGQWIYGALEPAKIHPGYFLPTVAGGLVASAAATTVGQRRLGEFMFGLGLICWLVMGSIIMNRLFVNPLLPPPLFPTLAIEVAPAPVASIAYFALNGSRIDAFAAILAGYGVLLVVAQIRFLPAYLRLTFSPAFWAFTFAYAAVASVTLIWINMGRPTGARALSWLVLGAITLLVGGVGARTLVAIARGRYFPPRPTPPPDVSRTA
jgi:tellurite resistance protein